jgi:hypothetical protein
MESKQLGGYMFYDLFNRANGGSNDMKIFSGTGTASLVSKELNRHFIGFEISPEYCKIAEKRLANIPIRLEVFS